MYLIAGFNRRLVLLLAVFSIPFVLIAVRTSVRSAPDVSGEFNYDIREDQTDESQLLMRSFIEDSGSSALVVEEGLKEIARGEAEIRSRFGDVKIEFNPRLGNAEVVGAERSGAPVLLTSPSKLGRVETLREFLKQNRALFSSGTKEIDELQVTADYTNPTGNLSYVHLAQSIDGVPVFGGEVKAGFTPRNEIVRIINGLAPNLPESVPSDFGDAREAAAYALTHSPESGARDAQKIYFPIAPGVIRPAWRVLVESAARSAYYIFDASTGTILWRKSLTEEQTQPATFEVYGNSTSFMKTADSPSPLTPGCLMPVGCPQPPAIARQQFTLIGNESPYNFNNTGWIPDGENRTIGNNVEAGIDRDTTQGIDPNGWAFGSPNRSFVYAYNPPPGIPAPGDDPFPVPQIYPPSPYQQGSIAHVFYTANRWHDELYRLGFTEQARNFQTDNFGRGGLGNDSLSIEIQEAIGTNGANFSTPADGGRPRGQFFIWTGPTPDRDGALDSQVVVHELTHGLSNRLHGNAAGLTSNMSRGMGEGWSDFYALAMLSEPSDDPCGTNAVGGYITYQILPGFEGNYYYGIRRFPVARRSCLGPNGRPHNPLTFRYINSDCNTLIGTTASDPPPNSAYPRGPIGVTTCDQVHNIGEVWAATLWEVRGFLIEAHGAAEGNRRALQYVTDGMKLAPIGPTMLQERDAIIAAAAASDPSDILPVRRGFAARGMGVSASIQNIGSGANNTVVTEAFDVVANAVIGAGFSVSDSIGNNNGFVEPGERVTISIPLINNGADVLSGVNLVATGLGGSAFYGDIGAGQTVTRNFAATIPGNAPCGGDYALSFSITSSAGQSTQTRTIFTGAPASSATFTNSTAVTINESGASTPYGTTIDVSGLTGAENRITLEITSISHTFPSDVDMLLVGPAGQKFVPVSDTGGNVAASNVTFSLTDFGSASLSESGWTSGNFKPADITAGDTFPAPAPAGPFNSPAPNGSATFASTFSGSAANLNGAWTLYIVDDANQDGGSLAGWKLKFETYACVICRVCLRGTRSDFDGDGRADLSVFRPNDGIWYQDRSVEGFAAMRWGLAGDRITPGDIDGDGRADIAVFRPAADPNLPDFYVLNSGTATYNGVSWGLPGDVPVVDDYDGDGRDDIAVYRPSSHTFYVRKSATNDVLTFSNIAFGTPVSGDFDGDGKADFVTYSFDGWYLSQSNVNYASVNFIRFGASGDKPVPADYDGDARDDFAVYRPSDQTWYVRRSSGGTTFFKFGLATDIPVPADYDGDGSTDFAIYRDGVWYIQRTTAGLLIRQFGLAGDVPVPSGYLP
ncbi:MAG: M36 family metallopeptidase [Acidobacteria bacterium]|nr:M36 family metallopeptidase [Acidobacteriota bacterium]